MPASPNRHREQEIFLGALTREGEERRRYLEAQCGNDADLLAGVLSLLRASERDGFVTAGGISSIARLSEAESASASQRERIGNYTLIAKLGEGGFGDVFLAEQQEPVARRVALKLLKPGMNSREVVARFEQERQALALMDHPNIAKVLDAGETVLGRPYFVMELVIGPQVTEYCAQRDLSMRQRLELFRQICNAVQHAHSKGVIHRDLKPSNVLVAEVDGAPVPKIIDFGIAKALDSAQLDHGVFTQQRVLIGTPQYMSPEQADGAAAGVDTRSDVYSLGVLLYELLTGTTPFDGERLRSAAIGEVARILREEDPPRPSTRVRAPHGGVKEVQTRIVERELRGELDWIIMKAMEKERSARYETASELAADITRYLRGDPVTAVPPHGLYLLRKLTARHRRIVLTAGVVGLAVLGGTAVAVWQAVRATRAERLQSQATARAESSARLAAQREAEARRHEQEAAEQAANFQAVNAFMQDGMLRMVMPQKARGRQVSMLEVVDGVAARLDAGELSSSPRVEAELRHSIGSIYQEIGRDAESERHLMRAIALCRSNQQTPADIRMLARSLNGLGVTLHETERSREAVAVFEEAAATLEKVGGRRSGLGFAVTANLVTALSEVRDSDRAESVARAALAETPQGAADDRTIARLTYSLAFALHAGEKSKDAEEPARRALRMLESAQPQDPVATAGALHLLGSILIEEEKYKEAGERLEAAYEVRRKVLGEQHPDTLRSLSGLAVVMNSTGRSAEAESIFSRVLQAREAGAPESAVSLSGLRNLASSQLDQGKLAEAETTLRRALAVSLSTADEQDADTLRITRLLGVVLHRKRAFAEAERFLAKAAAGMKERFGADSTPYAEALRDLGIVHCDLDKAALGAAELREAADIYSQNGLEDTPKFVSTLLAWGKALADDNRRDECIEVVDRGLAIATAEDPSMHSVRAKLLSQKGVALWRLGRPKEAEPCFRETIKLSTELYGAEHALVGAAWDSLAAQLKDQARYDEAEDAIQRAITIRRKAAPEGSDPLYWSCQRLFAIRLDAGRHEQAIEAAYDLMRIADRLYPPTHIQPLSARVNLSDAAHARASALIKAGDLEAARKVLERPEQILADLVALRSKVLTADDWRLAAHRVEYRRLAALRIIAGGAVNDAAATRSDLESAHDVLSHAEAAKAALVVDRAAHAAEALADLLEFLGAKDPADQSLPPAAARWRALAPAR